MADVFEVLGQDHQEVKRMLAELEKGPTAATGASGNHLALRKKMVEQLVIEESKHEALEEMYFWPAVRDKLADGDQLADTATGQEQEGKEVLAKLDKLEADQPEFEQLVSTFIAAGREHIGYEEGQVWPQLRSQLTPRRGAEHRGEDRGRQEDGADQAAPAHPGLAGGAEGCRASGRRGGPGPRRGHRPRPGLTCGMTSRTASRPGNAG